MSMTLEEAIKNREECLRYLEDIGAKATPSCVAAVRWSVKGLKALRPVSREQVILCKDCQYWQGNNGGYPHPECRWGNDETPDEDDYCSFAERLEVSKNG